MALQLKYLIICIISVGFVFCDDSFDVTVNSSNTSDEKSSTTPVMDNADYGTSTANINQDFKKVRIEIYPSLKIGIAIIRRKK